MKEFLRELCELWYWALFRPTRLQRRITGLESTPEWHRQRRQSAGINMLFSRPNRRLLGRFALLTALPLLPLSLAITNNINQQPLDWLLVPAAILGAYGLGVFFLPLGLHFPLLLLLTYLVRPEALREGIEIVRNHSPKLQQVQLGSGAIAGGLLLTGILSIWLLRHGWHKMGRAVSIGGAALSISFGGSIASGNPLLGLLCGGIVVLLLLSARSLFVFRSSNSTEATIRIIACGVTFCLSFGAVIGIMSMIATGITGSDTGYSGSPIRVAIAVAIAFGAAGGIGIAVTDGVTGGIAGSIAGGIAGGIALGMMDSFIGTIMGLAALPSSLFLLVGWFIGATLAPAQGRWHGLLAAGMLAGLGYEAHTLDNLLVIPAVLVGYYRLLPEYPLFALVSASHKRLIERGGRIDLLSALRVLPPYTSELLWVSLPGHEDTLAAAFHSSPTNAIETLQQMRTARLPGFRYTIRRALPRIVADQLLAVDTPADLVALTAPDHPILPLLAPTLYQEPEVTGNQATPSAAPPPDQREIAAVLLRLRAISSDIDRALKASSPFLRERGLEECLTRLTRLGDQLPGLELEAEAIPRWRTVLEHWQAILQTSLDQQRHLARSEVINPFQSGNPLRDDRPHLFKGRQSFADAIVRQVLEHGRPTLVLYGPRRCGKSSFLLNLSRLLPGAILPVYLDLQNPAVTAGTADFCYSLAHAIARALRFQGVRTETLQRADFAAGPYAALEDWLDLVLTPLEGRRILLCLDEFEKLSGAIGQGRLDRSLFDALRHLIQHRDELSFLFCGVQTLDELGPNWSSYFISVRPIEMTYLEEDEARAVLEDPDPHFDLGYAEGVVERALKVTNRQPYLLQLVGEEMVKQANRHHIRTVTTPLLEGALEAALAAGEPYFSNIWSECTGTNAEEIRAGQVLLCALACGHPLVLNGALTQAALSRLVRYHVLARTEGGYCFEVPMIARWIRERVPLI